MPYNVDPGQQEIREWTRKFCEKEVVPLSIELDRRPEPQKFPYDLYKKLSDYGMVGFSMPKEYGGSGASKILEATLLEELAYFDAAVCLLAAVSSFARYPIEVFGTEEQKRKYVPKIASGEYLSAYDLTEPSAGSGARNQQSVAKIDGDHFVINRENIF